LADDGEGGWLRTWKKGPKCIFLLDRLAENSGAGTTPNSQRQQEPESEAKTLIEKKKSER